MSQEPEEDEVMKLINDRIDRRMSPATTAHVDDGKGLTGLLHAKESYCRLVKLFFAAPRMLGHGGSC